MEVNKIPLNVRLERIKTGYAGDPAFVTHAIQSMADISLRDYLGVFPEERKRLTELLGMSKKAGEKLTYREAAWYIRRIRMLRGMEEKMNEAADILAMPLRRCYEERRAVYGTNTTDIS